MEFSPRWIFIAGGCQLRSLPSLLYTFAMFLFERTADVQKRPSVLFSHVLDGVCVWGRQGQEDLERKSREWGQVFESRRNVKLMSSARYNFTA